MRCKLCGSGSTKSFGNDHIWCMDCKGHEYKGHEYTRKEWDQIVNADPDDETIKFKHERMVKAA